ncbi:MAG: hypothetical protein ACE5J7_00850 [Candidatus Aenigmatarchaeota archaeon]
MRKLLILTVILVLTVSATLVFAQNETTTDTVGDAVNPGEDTTPPNETSGQETPAEPPAEEAPPAEEPAPPEEGPYIPEGCYGETDEYGNIRVICEEYEEPACMPVPEDAIEDCKRSGGEPDFFRDHRGCEVMHCRFHEEGGPSFIQPIEPGMCPTSDETHLISKKCYENGMRSIERRAPDGCIVVECVQREFERPECPSHEELEEAKRGCLSDGGEIVPFFDEHGCDVVDCIFPGEEPRECKPVPKEAFDECHRDGGELIVKEDERGCPYYVRCLRRGDERDIEYERIRDVPDSAKLLSLALKLESIKIEFDKLSQKTGDIADYYASTGDETEEQRFRRVSGMFAGAKTRIDEIKMKLRNRLEGIAIDDLMEIRHDIRYIKDVYMKDILYLMLTSNVSEFVGPAETEEEMFRRGLEGEELEGCGRDGGCFDAALRFCKPTKFFPPPEPGDEGPPGEIVIEIVGLEGENCIIKGSMEIEKAGVTMDMTCKYPNYAMGMRGPEDLLPHCEGPFADMARQHMEEEKQRRELYGPESIYEPRYEEEYRSRYIDEEPIFEEDIYKEYK